MKKYTSIQETEKLVELLKQKPEIDEKISYYKGVLKSTDEQIKSIQKRIDRGYTTETFKFLGIPIFKKIMLDEYNIAKLEIEKLEAESKLFYQKQYFENWLSRSRDYDVKMSEIKADCNANFDKIMEEAVEVAKRNIRLQSVMNEYPKKNPDHKDEKVKLEYYLYVKKEVENSKQYGKPQFQKQN